MPFLLSITFLCIFKKTDQKKCVCLFSVKLNQSRNTKKFFFSISKVFLHVFFIVKGSFTTIFTQKYLLLLGLMEFFKNVNLNAPCATKFWIQTFKIIPDLRLSAVFCPIKKIKNHSTLICTVHQGGMIQHTFLLIRYIFRWPIPKNRRISPRACATHAQQSFHFQKLQGPYCKNEYFWGKICRILPNIAINKI